MDYECRKRINLIIDIIIIIFLSSFIICSYYGHSQIKQFQDYYINTLFQNWVNGPIMDLEVTDKNSCSDGYGNVLTENNYSGFSNGCYCPNSNKLYRYNCNSSMLPNCNNINGIPQRELNYWRGKIICGKRLVTDYFSQVLVKYNSNCPLNYTKCGVMDSFNNSLCVNNTSTCPINFIKIVSDNDSEIFTSPQFKKIPLDNDTYIIYSNSSTDSRILIDFYISDGLPCSDPYYLNNEQGLPVLAKINALNYPLENNINNYGCSSRLNTYDYRWQYLDKANYFKLLVDNNVINQYLTVPILNIRQYYNYNISLYTRNYIGLDIAGYNFIVSNVFNLTTTTALLYLIRDNTFAYSYYPWAFFLYVFAYLILFICMVIYFIPRVFSISYVINNVKLKLSLEIALAVIVLLNSYLSLKLYLILKRVLNPYNLIFLNAEADLITKTLLNEEYNVIVNSKFNYFFIFVASLLLLPLILLDNYIIYLTKYKRMRDVDSYN